MAIYGTNLDLRLPNISEQVREELRGHEIAFSGFTELKLTDIKGYTARMDIDAEYGGHAARAAVILFRPSDGTGNKIAGKPMSHWTPRPNPNYAELFVPVGTVCNDRWYGQMTSLTELMADGSTHPLTLPRDEYILGLRAQERIKGGMVFTKLRDYGAVHVTIFDAPAQLNTDSVFQIGAFIALPQGATDLLEKRL